MKSLTQNPHPGSGGIEHAWFSAMYQVTTYYRSWQRPWPAQEPVVLRRKLYRWRWTAKLACELTHTLRVTGCYWKEWRPHLRLVK